MLRAQHLAVTLSLTAATAVAWVAAVVPCGDKNCREPEEYCSENAFCDSCQDICEITSHNYDEHTCKDKCSAYIRSHFVTREDLDAAVARVYVYVIFSLVISVVILLLVVSAFLAVWIKYQRIRGYSSGSLKKKKMETIKAVCVNEVDGNKKLKLQMPVTIPDNKDTPPSALTTMTPLSTRHPSEDATLEYAYDNPTLTPSPVFGQHTPKSQPHPTPNTTPKTARTETSF